MLSLVSRYKAGAVSMPEFMTKAREILGDRLYGQLARDMNKAAQVQAQQVQMAHQMPAMRPPPPSVFTHPQMFAPPPSMLASQYYAPPVQSFPLQQQQQQQQQPMLHQPTEVDVSKMDTSSLQDVIQYSGVDLKAEAEALYREHDQPSSYNQNLVDHRLKVDYFFNPLKMRAILQSSLQRQYLNNRTASTNPNGAQEKPLNISEESIQILGIAIQKRLIGILRRLAELSRHRVDYGRGRFKIKIENDPKKQLWLLEKLFIEGLARKDDQNTPANTNSTINTLPSLPNTKTKDSKEGKEGKDKEPAKAPTEDLSIKTKLANVTAMAALGIRQKSWMSGASTNEKVTSTASNSEAKEEPAAPGTSNDNEETQVHPLSAFYSLASSTPLSDAELKAQYYSRTISIVDLISCMESDSHLKRSKLLAVLYEALPRENKEYKADPQ